MATVRRLSLLLAVIAISIFITGFAAHAADKSKAAASPVAPGVAPAAAPASVHKVAAEGDLDVVGTSPETTPSGHLAYSESRTFRMFVKNQGKGKSAPASVRWSSYLTTGGGRTHLATSTYPFPALEPQAMISLDFPFSLADAVAASKQGQVTGPSDVELTATIADGTLGSRASTAKARTWKLRIDAPMPDLEITSSSPIPSAPIHLAYNASKPLSITIRNLGPARSAATLVDWKVNLIDNGDILMNSPVQLPALDPNESRTFPLTFNFKDLITTSGHVQIKKTSAVNVNAALRDGNQSKNADAVTSGTLWTLKVDPPTALPDLVFINPTPATNVDFKLKYGVARKFSVTIKNKGNLKSHGVQIYWASYVRNNITNGVFSFASESLIVGPLNPGETFTTNFNQAFIDPRLKDPGADLVTVNVSFVDISQSSDTAAADKGLSWTSAVTH